MNKTQKFSLAVVAIAIIAISVIVGINQNSFNSFSRKNVNALCDAEVKGYCMEKSGLCLFRCSGCGNLFEAINHDGPSYNMSGSCPVCGNNAD